MSSVRNSTVYLGQDLKQFPFWSYFVDVCYCFKPISFKLSSDVPSLVMVSAQIDLRFLTVRVFPLFFFQEMFGLPVKIIFSITISLRIFSIPVFLHRNRFHLCYCIGVTPSFYQCYKIYNMCIALGSKCE